jgi:hypothetical protein
MAEKSSGSWSPRRKDACEATLALFLEVVGDRPIASYSKADARDFKAVLRVLPPNRTRLKKLRGLDVRDAAKTAQDLGLEPMSLVNANKQLTIIYGLFEWLKAHYEVLTSNPFANAKIATKSNVK